MSRVRMRSPDEPGMRSATRMLQVLKLAIAELTPVYTPLRVTREEAAALSAYLLAHSRGAEQAFILRERHLWRMVCEVNARAPEGYGLGLEGTMPMAANEGGRNGNGSR